MIGDSAIPTEQILLHLYERMSDGVLGFDSEGTIVFSNPATSLICGKPTEDLLGLRVRDLLGVDLRDHETSAGSSLMEAEIRRESGVVRYVSIKTFELSATPPIKVAILRDQTRAKLARESLRRSEDKLRMVLQGVPAALWSTDLELRMTSCVGAALERLGLSPGAFIGHTIPEIVTAAPAGEGGDRHGIEAHRRALEGHEQRFVTRFRNRVYQVWLNPHRAGGGDVEGVVGIALDVTDLARANEALRLTSKEYQDLFNESASGFFICSTHGRLLNCNDEFSRMFGYSRVDEALGRGILHGLQNAEGKNFVDLIKVSPHIEGVQFRGQGRDGVDVYARITCHGRFDDEGKLLALQGSAVDVSESKLFETKLIRTRAELSAVFEAFPDTLLHLDRHGIILDANGCDTALFGIDPAASEGKALTVLFPPQIAGLFTAALAATAEDRMVRSFEFHHDSAAGKRQYYEARLVPVAEEEVVSVIRNITLARLAEIERRELQAQILQTQKTESLGLLAGGVAHDFNNLLMGILANAGLAIMESDPDSEASTFLRQIETTALRAADLTKQMLAYAGKGRLTVESVNVNVLVREMAALLNSVVNKNAKLQLELNAEPAIIEADATQLRQVVMNLITNASDALLEKAGTIIVRTEFLKLARETSPAENVLSDPLPAGDYLRLTVVDSGCGMSPATRARIFDPFFTTKSMGRGLGLAAAMGIMRGHKGALSVTSALGSGTRFDLYFPLLASQTRVVRREVHSAYTRKMEGTILIVDDEEYVRSVTQAILRRVGYTVLAAKDGVEALEVMARERIDAVLLDMIMPRMAGAETLTELRKLRPTLPVLIVSGYSEEETFERCRRGPSVDFLPKPYRPEDLLFKLEQLLAAARR